MTNSLRPKTLKVLDHIGLDINNITVERVSGITNVNWKVVDASSGNKYLVKEISTNSDGLVDRSLEKLLIESNPELILYHYDLDEGLIIMNFLEGYSELDKQDINDMYREIVNAVKSIHDSSLSDSPESVGFDLPSKIREYMSILGQFSDNTYMQEYKILDSYQEYMYYLATLLNYSSKIKRTMCHNDLATGNILKSSDGKIILLDYEYAGVNDPAWDYASLLLEHSNVDYYNVCNLAHSKILNYIGERYGEDYGESMLLRITICMLLQDYLWSIWAVIYCIRTNHDPDYVSYMKSRIRRVINFMMTSSTTSDYFISKFKESI